MKRKSAVRFWERLSTFLDNAEAEGIVNRDDIEVLEIHIPRNNPELALAEPFIGYVLNDSNKETWEHEVLDEDKDEIVVLQYHSGEVVKGEVFYYFKVDPEDSSEEESKAENENVNTQAG